VLIDALSTDGSGCKKLESSTAAPFAGLFHLTLVAADAFARRQASNVSLFFAAKVWVSPSERYAIVPDENVSSVHRTFNLKQIA